MIKKHYLFAMAGLLAVASLASCGTVAGISSERPRGITNEQEQNQIHERIEKNKAERAARTAERAAKFN